MGSEAEAEEQCRRLENVGIEISGGRRAGLDEAREIERERDSEVKRLFSQISAHLHHR